MATPVVYVMLCFICKNARSCNTTSDRTVLPEEFMTYACLKLKFTCYEQSMYEGEISKHCTELGLFVTCYQIVHVFL